MSVHKTGGSAKILDRELHNQLVAIFMDVFQLEIQPEIENIERSEVGSWDSINHLRLVSTIEEVFQVTLSDEEVVTIADLCALKAILLRQCAMTQAS